MYLQAKTEIVTQVEVHGYVVNGAASTLIEPAEGLTADVEAVYELSKDGKPMSPNLVEQLNADALEQIEEALMGEWIRENG